MAPACFGNRDGHSQPLPGRGFQERVEAFGCLEGVPADADHDEAGSLVGWTAQIGGDRLRVGDDQADAARLRLAAGGRRRRGLIRRSGVRFGPSESGKSACADAGQKHEEAGWVAQSGILSSRGRSSLTPLWVRDLRRAWAASRATAVRAWGRLAAPAVFQDRA